MSGVLEVMDRYGFTCGDKNSEISRARAAIAELIEADREYDEADAAWREAQINATGDESPGAWNREARKQYARLGAAARRRAAALSAVTGGGE